MSIQKFSRGGNTPDDIDPRTGRKKKIHNRLHSIDVEELSFVDHPANRRGFVLTKRQGNPEDPDYTPGLDLSMEEQGLWRLKKEAEEDGDTDLTSIIGKFQSNPQSLTKKESKLLGAHLNILAIKTELAYLKKALSKLSKREVEAVENGFPADFIIDEVGDSATIRFLDTDGKVLEKGLQFGPNKGERSHYMGNDGAWHKVHNLRHPSGKWRPKPGLMGNESLYMPMKQPDGSLSTASLQPNSNIDAPVPPLDYRSVLDGGDYSMAPPQSLGGPSAVINITVGKRVSSLGSPLTADGELEHTLIKASQDLDKAKKPKGLVDGQPHPDRVGIFYSAKLKCWVKRTKDGIVRAKDQS